MLAITAKFPEKRAFVTGAGSGLGEALALLLAADGWRIGMTDIAADRLEKAAESVRERGGEALTYAFDTGDAGAFGAAAEDFLAQCGGVDLVVNNAGVAGAGEIGAYRLEDWDWLMRVNLHGVIHGCHFFGPALREQGRGHLLNIASAAGFVPVPRMAAYCTAKAGVTMLSEVLYNELAPHGAGVSVLMPYFFRTRITESARGPEAGAADTLVTKARMSAEEVARAALAGVAKGKLHIVHPYHTRVLFHLKRLFPGLFMRRVQAESQRMRDRAARQAAREQA